ncbi:hypothetical protein [Paraburkholderia sacchari]|uniref:hypothetical protein n=1 Tax=Paraburkholderia sacchari TaxID=159450 RepID=UPI003D97CDB7
MRRWLRFVRCASIGDGDIGVIDPEKHAGVNPSKSVTEGNFFGDYTGAKGARNGKRLLRIGVSNSLKT